MLQEYEPVSEEWQQNAPLLEPHGFSRQVPLPGLPSQ
jgi:hypothetical protein